MVLMRGALAMADAPYKNASIYLEQDHQALGPIFDKVKLLNGLNQKISAYLGPAQAPYCQVANLVGNTLVLMAANGSIATHLRFMTWDLLKQFKKDPVLKHIQRIECKVCPVSPASAAPVTNMDSLSQETSKIVQEIAQSIQDPKLRDVMLRIASHRKKTDL